MTAPTYAIDWNYRPLLTVAEVHEADVQAAGYLQKWLNYKYGNGTVHGAHIRKFLASPEYASREFDADRPFLASWGAAEIDSAQRRGPRLMEDLE